MTLKHLQVFLEIASCENMSKAAQNLHFSQPTLSQILKELEEYYQCKLFRRKSRGLQLTTQGKILETEGKKVLTQFEHLEHTMREKIQETKSSACTLLHGGLDYRKASLEIRELFSLTKSKQQDFYLFLQTKEEISGAVLLSTCNRCELFLSVPKTSTPLPSPFGLICDFLQLNWDKYQEYSESYEEKQVFTHLSHLASGVKSQIFGEDQIITQVKLAQIMAREFQAIDSYLEVLFRLGITCGKKIRSDLNLAQRDTSMSQKVLEVGKNLGISRYLVVGNGEMARHVGELLTKEHSTVYMSVRSYRHNEVKLPKDVIPVNYEEIYSIMPQVEAVISATLSPHYTIIHSKYSELKPYPKILFDLAVPRDIDPHITNLEGIQLYNVDQLSQYTEGNAPFQKELLENIKKIVDKYQKDLDKWVFYKWREETE